MKPFKLLIGGELVDGDRTIDVINPANEDILARCPAASENQINAAISAAKAAFPKWSRLSLDLRRDYLVKIADGLKLRADEFARLLTQEQGKPLAEAQVEIGASEAFFRYFATMDLPLKVIEDSDTRRVEAHRRPLGVVAAIVPWNFPILVMAFKLPFALLAGNTVVVKPAATTPLTTLRFGELCADILPPGVVNIITDKNDLGAVLTSHKDVRKVSFTGSTETGKKVMASAADTIKRLTLELGGNDAAIVLNDVDPKKVAPGIFAGAFMNAGQVCLAIKRVYAHEDIYDDLCAELGALAEAAVVGDGLQQGTTIGPLQNRMQYDKVRGFLDDARSNGKIVAGGDLSDQPGYFIRPTIVRDVTDGMKIVDEEQFGPILPIIKYADREDALSRANASPYGLGGSVWATDPDAAYDLAKRMDTGTVWINKHLDFGPHIPFGGAKMSGVGTEFAEEGLAEFTQLHIINMAR